MTRPFPTRRTKSVFGKSGRRRRLERGIRLGYEKLEDRVVLDSRFLGMLEFRSDELFAPDNSIESEVQVGFAKPDPINFQPLITLPDGVAVKTDDQTATIRSTLVAGGLTFTGSNLTFSADVMPERYTVSGNATIIVGGSTIALDLGQNGSEGLVLENDALTVVDATINSSFELSGVTFSTQDLRLSYDTTASSRYTITGDASVDFIGASNSPVSAIVHFGAYGSQDTPGLVIQDGQLEQLYVSVTSDFSIAGIDITTDKLGFFYNAAADEFGLYGTAKISTALQGGARVLDDFGVTLGEVNDVRQPSAPGILIRDGVLEEIDFTLDGSFTLAKLQVMPNYLRVTYTRATSVLQFTGELSVSLGPRINGSVGLPEGGITINTSSGMVQIQGLRLEITDTKIGVVKIRDAFVLFTDDGAGSFDLTGGAMVDLPAGLSVDGSFAFASGKLRQIKIDVSKTPGIALGSTGVFVNRVLADVNHIDDLDRLQLTGTVGLTAGPSFRVGGQERAFIQGMLQVRLDQAAGKLMFSGNVDLVGGLIPAARGEITLYYNPDNGRPTSAIARLTQNYFAGFIRTTYTIRLSSSGDIDASAVATIRTPKFLSFKVAGIKVPLGGRKLGSVTIKLHFIADDPGNSTISFAVSALGSRGQVIVNLHGDVTLHYRVNLLFTSKKGSKFFDGVLPDLFPTPPTPPPIVPPEGYEPTATIHSVERIPGTPDIGVAYEGTTLNPADTTMMFAIGYMREPIFNVKLPVFIPGSQTTLPVAAGVQAFTIQNVDRFLEPGREFFVFLVITDGFYTQPVIQTTFEAIPPIIDNPLSVVAPTLAAYSPVSATPIPGIRIIDSSAEYSPDVQVNVFLRVPAGEISVPALPPTVTGDPIAVNGTGYVILTGTADDINALLAGLTYTPVLRLEGDLELTIGVNRAPGETAYAEAIVRLKREPLVLELPASVSVDQSDFTTVNEVSVLSDVSLASASAGLLTKATITISDNIYGTDSLFHSLPAGSPISVFSSPSAGVLTFAGKASIADYVAALKNVTFLTYGTDETKSLMVTVADDLGNIVEAEIELLVNVRVVPQDGVIVYDEATEDLPKIIAGSGTLVYQGGDALPVSPQLTVEYTGQSPLTSGQIAFTGDFDPTSDVLTFTATDNITEFVFDPDSGVLSLFGQATPEEYQEAFRSVGYRSERDNPLAFTREVTFTLSNGTDVNNIAGARAFVRLAKEAVPPQLTADNPALAIPQESDFVEVFTDFTAESPDARLAAPPFVLGEFAGGTMFVRASVVIGTNYVPGEDLLTFTPTENVTGEFFTDTGELLLSGKATLAEYEQVVRSIQYRNANPSPSTEDRLIIATLDDGSASGNPATASRILRPLSDGGGPTQIGGEVTPLILAPDAQTTSLGLTAVAYAPKPGETQLIFTITDIPQGNQGDVILADGTPADIDMVVSLEQLRGATIVPADAPVAGTSSFTFTVAGQNPITAMADPDPLIATVEITTLNGMPVAGDDAAAAFIDAPATIAVLDNDTDANEDNLFITQFSTPEHGTVAYTEDGLALIYTPHVGFTGPDSFTYTADDQQGGTTTGTVRIEIGAPEFHISPSGPNGTPDPPNLPTGDQPTSWSRQRSDIRRIVIDLPAAIETTAATESSVLLTNLGMNAPIDSDSTIALHDNQLSLSADRMKLTISLDSHQLTDGVYQLQLLPAITGGATFTHTGNATNKFHRLRGDWNGSGTVDLQDFDAFAYWFGSAVPTAPAYVDSNGSGGVNIQDFAAFAANFGKGLSFSDANNSLSSYRSGEGELESAIRTLIHPPDINGDGAVTPRDALNVINELERGGSATNVGWSRFDANRDGNVTAVDALYVINRIGGQVIRRASSIESMGDPGTSTTLLDPGLLTKLTLDKAAPPDHIESVDEVLLDAIHVGPVEAELTSLENVIDLLSDREL